MMNIALVVIASYLIGSISPSYLIGKHIAKIDIKKSGSGNAGTTNAFRTLGKRLGAVTFIVDLLKGMIAVMVGQKLFGETGGILAALFVVIGHDFPFYLKFNGGKGVATSLGTVLVLDFKLGVICLVIAFVVMLLSNMVSLGSIMGFASAPFSYVIMNDDFDMKMLLLILALLALTVYRHKNNIVRIIKGEENKIRK